MTKNYYQQRHLPWGWRLACWFGTWAERCQSGPGGGVRGRPCNRLWFPWLELELCKAYSPNGWSPNSPSTARWEPPTSAEKTVEKNVRKQQHILIDNARFRQNKTLNSEKKDMNLQFWLFFSIVTISVHPHVKCGILNYLAMKYTMRTL